MLAGAARQAPWCGLDFLTALRLLRASVLEEGERENLLVLPFVASPWESRSATLLYSVSSNGDRSVP